MSRRRTAGLALVAVTAVVLAAAACGDDEQEGPAAEKPLGLTPTVEAAPTEEIQATPTVEAVATEEPTPEPTEEVAPTVEPAPEPTEEVAPAEPPAPSTQTLEIAMVPSIQFDKSTLAVQSGATVTVRLENREGGIPHNFAVYTDSSASQSLAEGSIADICTGPCSDEIMFVAPGPGEYFFRCDVHPSQMTGTLIVE